MRRTTAVRKRGPIRAIIGQAIGSDGLVYDELECRHWLLLTWREWQHVPPSRRYCPLCGKWEKPPLASRVASS